MKTNALSMFILKQNGILKEEIVKKHRLTALICAAAMLLSTACGVKENLEATFDYRIKRGYTFHPAQQLRLRADNLVGELKDFIRC